MKTIKKSEYAVLCFFLMTSIFWGFTTYSLFNTSSQDSWLSIIVSFILSFAPLLIYYLLLNHNVKFNIVDLINHYFGKLGYVINIILIIFITLLASGVLWNLINFISSQYLYQTPKLVIAVLFMITSCYVANKGLSTIGRCGTVFFIINIILFLISALALIGKFRIDELLPFLENGLFPVIKGGCFNICYNIFPLFTILIIPKDNIEDNKKMIKSFMKVYLTVFLIMFFVVLLTISVLGNNLANLYQYPEYHILKTINIADFFQRVESILSSQMIFSFFMAVIFYLYYIKTAFIQTFKIKNYDHIISIVFSIIIIFLSQNIFKNTTIAETFIVSIYPIISTVFLFVIPLIILITIKIKKRLK